MRAALVLLSLLVLPASASAEIGKTRRVGPWNVGAVAEKGQFRHCIMARPETERSAGFGVVRGRDYLTLALFSKKWKLDTGTSYPVTLKAGDLTEELQATVEGPTSVVVALTGRDSFVEGWARSRTLEVRTPASTLRLPIDQSAEALRTLEACYAKEAKVAANPFAPAAPKPGDVANPFGPPAQAQAPSPAPAAKPPAPTPAEAAYAKSRADCEQDEDADRQIAGCTVVIESGREATEVAGIAYANRGFGYVKKGDLLAAIASFSGAIRLYPQYPNAWWGRADARSERRQYDEAIADYTEALRLVPNDAELLNNRAVAKLHKRDLDGALADVEEALRINGKSALALDTRAQILAEKGEHARALADYEEALRLAPDLAVAAEGKRKVEAALTAAAAARAKTDIDEAAVAVGVLEVAPQRCGFSPVMGTIIDIARRTGLGPEAFESGPQAAAKRRATEAAAAAARADKAAFCERVWAEYGDEGTRLADLFSR